MSSSVIVSKIESEKRNRTRVGLSVTCVVVCLLVLSIMSIGVFLENERKDLEEYLIEITRQSAISANSIIKGDFQALNVYAHVLEQNPKMMDKNSIKVNLQNAIKNTTFYSLGLAYPDGSIIIYDAKKGIVPVSNVNGFKYFEEGMLGRKYVDFINCFYDDDSLIVLYAVPVIKNGKSVAVLTGAHNVKDFIKAIEIATFNDEANVHIIDGKGNIILRDNNPRSYLKYSIFENYDVPNNIREKALSAKKPTSYWFKDANGIEKVTAYVPVEYKDWKVFSVLPHNAFSHYSDMMLKYVLVFFILINALVILAIRYDVIARLRSNNMIMDIALQDDVTKISNKTCFLIEGEKMLLKKYADDEKLALILMDIDSFKIVNEVYNTKMGDKVLKDIAKIFGKCVEENGIFARINDDIFATMYKYTKEDELIEFIERIRIEITKFKLNIKMEPKFGIYRIADKKLPIDRMLDKASMAKRTIKGQQNGKCYAFFTEKLSLEMLAEKEIENEMKPALEANQFVMYLQPKIDMKTMKPCGSEALIRWKHPKKGLIPPYKFIPLFERNGFIVDVDKYMWEQACIAIRSWIDAGYEPLPISVNLSRIHFKFENLVEILDSLVKKYYIPKKYLELELTESAFLDNEGIVNSTLIKLQDLGFTIAMDDFGMGYSSLNMLRKLPVNVLKLDRGFINEATCTERGFIVLNYVIHMAKDLNATVVCEGIETEEQAQTLKTAGCDIAQGFLYAKPMPLEDYNKFVYHVEIEQT